MTNRVEFTPEAMQQLTDLYNYIADVVAPSIATKYTEDIISFCEDLRTFPNRGTSRDDVRPGLQITNYKKRVVIAYQFEFDLVSIIGIFYGGRNFEAALRNDRDSRLDDN